MLISGPFEGVYRCCLCLVRLINMTGNYPSDGCRSLKASDSHIIERTSYFREKPLIMLDRRASTLKTKLYNIKILFCVPYMLADNEKCCIDRMTYPFKKIAKIMLNTGPI
jgi:hypothetical protein